MKSMFILSLALFAALWVALSTQMPPAEALCRAWPALLLAPLIPLLRYYVIAPLVEKCAPVCFCGREPGPEPRPAQGEQGVKLTSIPLPPGDSLLVRDESYTAGYTEHVDCPLRKGTCLLLSWRYWFMSYTCGLRLLTRFTNPAHNPGSLDIAVSSNDPDEYFSIITLEPGQRYYVTPSDIVAISGGVDIRACWRLWLPAWCMGQVRAYVLSGHGRVVVRAMGGITAGSLEGGRVAVRKLHSLVCASQGVHLHVRRTETFLSFLLGKADLFDLRLVGSGSYCIRNAAEPAAGPGKLIGF